MEWPSPIAPLTGRSAETAARTPTRQGGGIRGVLSGLFPATPPVTVPSAWRWRLLAVVAQVFAVVAAAAQGGRAAGDLFKAAYGVTPREWRADNHRQIGPGGDRDR